VTYSFSLGWLHGIALVRSDQLDHFENATDSAVKSMLKQGVATRLICHRILKGIFVLLLK